MRQFAKQGDPRAQKEYAAMLRKQAALKKTYAEAYNDEEIEMMAAGGYEVGTSTDRSILCLQCILCRKQAVACPAVIIVVWMCLG